MMFGVTRGGRARVMRFGISVSSSETATKRGRGPRLLATRQSWGPRGSEGMSFEAGLRGFFAAFPLLRFALAVLVTFFRATFFVALPFVLLLAIDAPSPSRGVLDHIAHRSLVDPEGRTSPPYAGRL